MARGAAKQRTARPKPKPEARRGPARRRPNVAEQTMFFPRLRRKVKWMFVFLALVFAVGFVVFNVGSGGGGTGIGDLLLSNDSSSSGLPSAKKARERIAKNPKDAKAYNDLATALEADGKTDGAIAALEQYTKLRPKDESALNRLAAAYRTKVTKLQNEYQQIQLEAQVQLPGQLVGPPPLEARPGQPLVEPPIDRVLKTAYTRRVQIVYTGIQTSLNRAVATYQRAVKLNRNDPTLQLQLAETAQFANQTDIALAAYKRFLKLAPDDTNATFVKQQIKQLEQAPSKTSAAGSSP
jgi:tetratricopeptide (TPR) repeat protein